MPSMGAAIRAPEVYRAAKHQRMGTPEKICGPAFYMYSHQIALEAHFANYLRFNIARTPFVLFNSMPNERGMLLNKKC